MVNSVPKNPELRLDLKLGHGSLISNALPNDLQTCEGVDQENVLSNWHLHETPGHSTVAGEVGLVVVDEVEFAFPSSPEVTIASDK